MKLRDLIHFFKTKWYVALFIISVLTVIVVRLREPLYLAYLWDTVALMETAHRLSNGLGLTSSLFTIDSHDLSEITKYQTMNWWAPLTPYILSIFLMIGLEDEMALKLFFSLSILLGWTGWLYLSLRCFNTMLLKNWPIALFFSLMPLAFTRIKDADEFLAWALLPWVAISLSYLFGGNIKLGIFLNFLTCAVILFSCYFGWFYIAASLITIVFYPARIRQKFFALVIILPLLTLSYKILTFVNGGYPPYLSQESIKLTAILPLCFSAIQQSGLYPIITYVDALLPSSLISIIIRLNEVPLSFIISLITYLILGVIVLFSLGKSSSQAALKSNLLFLSLVFLGLPVFLLFNTIKNQNFFNYMTWQSYYSNLVPLVYFLFISLFTVFQNHQKLRIICNVIIIPITFFLLISLTTFFSDGPSRGKAMIVGYSFKGDEALRYRNNIYEIIPNDFDISVLDSEPPGIVYSIFPHFISLVNKKSPHTIRTTGNRSYWKNAFASKDTYLYFILPEGQEPAPISHLLITFQDADRHSMPELLKLPGWQALEYRVTEYGGSKVIYKATLPSGWTAKSIFSDVD